MTYITALFLPPLGLLLNGQVIQALINVVLIGASIIFLPPVVLVAPLHALIAIYNNRNGQSLRAVAGPKIAGWEDTYWR